MSFSFSGRPPSHQIEALSKQMDDQDRFIQHIYDLQSLLQGPIPQFKESIHLVQQAIRDAIEAETDDRNKELLQEVCSARRRSIISTLLFFFQCAMATVPGFFFFFFLSLSLPLPPPFRQILDSLRCLNDASQDESRQLAMTEYLQRKMRAKADIKAQLDALRDGRTWIAASRKQIRNDEKMILKLQMSAAHAESALGVITVKRGGKKGGSHRAPAMTMMTTTTTTTMTTVS